MYVGGCIFVNLATNHIHIEFQSKLNTYETAKAKEAYELMCRDHGVILQSYHSDNGSSFTSKGFAEHLQNFAQISTFAGVGAHHHNAAAERAISTIMSISQTMMLHSAIHWPDVADACLWPMAVEHAVFLYNHVPALSSGLSPPTSSPRLAGRSESFMIFMYGAAPYTFWIRRLLMARSYRIGSLEVADPCIWACQRNMRQPLH